MCPSCRLLATCSADQTCKIWRTSNFSLMTELSIKSNNPGETSRGWMWDCAFSGDSQYIVTGEAPPGLCQGPAPTRPDQLPWLGHCQSLGHGGCKVGAPSATPRHILLTGAFCLCCSGAAVCWRGDLQLCCSCHSSQHVSPLNTPVVISTLTAVQKN